MEQNSILDKLPDDWRFTLAPVPNATSFIRESDGKVLNYSHYQTGNTEGAIVALKEWIRLERAGN